MLVQKNCICCAVPFSARLADHKRGWGKFCDKSCSAAYKVGMRPRDVNAGHAKKSVWAEKAYSELLSAGLTEWPKAPPVHIQLGHKVKIQPTYHSPSSCRECGAPTKYPGMCLDCETHIEGMNAMEEGWDGHKVWAE